jgi:hypothetical protein
VKWKLHRPILLWLLLPKSKSVCYLFVFIIESVSVIFWVSFTLQIIKKSQFTLKRRKGKPDEFDSDDWVCPPFDSSDLDNDKTSCPKVIGHL